jgi:nicotinamide mononucleotide transporter
MNELLAWMTSSPFTLFGAPVSWIEIIGFVTGAACVYGVAKQHLWNWPVGILNNVAFTILFLGSGLYADSFLQIIFAAVAAYGWWNWARGSKSTELKNDLPIRDATPREAVLGGIATVGITFLIASLLTSLTNSTVPYADAFILAASLVATYGQAKKIFQHWYVWIAVDVVSIPLYFHKGLTLTAILYIGFLGLCIYGLIDWKRVRGIQTEAPRELVAA